jgi:hypothetical protein
MRSGCRRKYILAAAVGAGSLFSSFAQAATWTWTGGGSTSTPTTGSWNAAANWSPASIPSSANTTALQFNGSGSTVYTSTNNITNQIVGTISLNSTASVTNGIAGTNSLNTNNSVTIEQLSTGAFNISMPFTLDGKTLTLSGNQSGVVTLSGTVMGSGNGSHMLSLVKDGSSTYVVSGTGNNNWNGTTVNGGKLLFNSTNANGGGQVTVNSTGVVGGSGSVNAAITLNSGATLMPGTGDSGGGLSLSNNITISNGRTLDIQSSSSSFALLTVSANVTLGGTLSLKANFQPALETPIVILNKTTSGAISGTFAGLAQNAYFHPTAGPNTSDWYSISYTAGDGNDIAIVRHSVPEPGAVGLMLLGVPAILRRRSRR